MKYISDKLIYNTDVGIGILKFFFNFRTLFFLFCVILTFNLKAQKIDSISPFFSQHYDVNDSLLQNSESFHYLLSGDFTQKEYRKFSKILSSKKDTHDLSYRLLHIGNLLESEGFAGWNADITPLDSGKIILNIQKGPIYHVASFQIKKLPIPVWQYSGGNKLYRKNTKYTRIQTEDVFFKILGYYQDHGYPFSQLHKDTIEFAYGQDSTLTKLNISYRFEPGNLYKIDSFLILTKIRESSRFVKNILRIQEGDIYNHSEISSIPVMLNNTIYYQQVPQPEVTFTEEGKVSIRIKPEVRKSSRFDGIIGVLPPVDTSANLQLTGLLDFQLVSPFGYGEILSMRFEQLPVGSQRLGLKYIQPWILGTPVKTETELNLFKQDTTFLTRFFKVTPYYQLNRYLSLKAWFRNKSSALLSSSLYRTSKTLPPVLDSRDQALGFGFEYEKLDYRLNPTKGFVLKTDFGAGNKVIRRNAGLDSLDYDQILLNLPSREFYFYFRYFISPFKRNVIMVGNQTFRLDLAQYFRNDLQTIGGSQLLRGFNENQFFARYYSLFTFEYRYLLDRNSNLFVFIDHAIIDWREANLRQEFRPTGIGGGLNFETRAGILNLTFATGRVGDISFTPARPRVHFGIVSLF